MNPWVIAFSLCALLLVGCGPKQESRLEAMPGEIVERVGDIAILRAETPAFDQLSENDCAAAWYLSQAILAGREISRDQIYPGQAAACRFLETMGANLDYGIIPSTVQPFRLFLKNLQIHDGFYNVRTGRKIPLGGFDDRGLTNLLFVAQANSGGKLGSLIEVNLMRTFIVDTLFNPAKDSLLFDWDSNAGRWTILPPGFYDGASPSEAQAFSGKYTANSRLTHRDGVIAEQVLRAGDEELASGLFADPLRRVIDNLEKGRPYFPAPLVPAADLLKEYLRTGVSSLYDSAAIIRRSASPPVDFILGFADTRLDPFGQKGLWTGLLFLEDEAQQVKIARLVQAWPELGAALPGGSESYQAASRIKAVQLLAASGVNGALCPDVYRDPPSSDAQSHRQSLIFTNILKVRAQVRAKYLESLFCMNPNDSLEAVISAPDLAFTRITIGEMPGLEPVIPSGFHRNGAVSIEEVIREVIRQAQIWWLAGDLKLAALGMLPVQANTETYRSLARQYLISLADFSSDRYDYAVLPLLGNYLLETGALVLEEVQGKTYCLSADSAVVRGKLAQLIHRLQPATVARDQQLMNEFVSKYGGSNPEGLSREVAQRLQAAAAFNQEAFLLPLVRARINPMGGLEEVFLDQARDFNHAMLIYSGLEPTKGK